MAASCPGAQATKRLGRHAIAVAVAASRAPVQALQARPVPLLPLLLLPLVQRLHQALQLLPASRPPRLLVHPVHILLLLLHVLLALLLVVAVLALLLALLQGLELLTQDGQLVLLLQLEQAPPAAIIQACPVKSQLQLMQAACLGSHHTPLA